MNRAQLQERLEVCQRELAAIACITPNCKNCTQFGAGHCEKFGPVPAEFIDKGCGEWEWDDVPF